MPNLSDSLKDSIKSVVSGSSSEGSLPFLKISSKNFLAFSGMARDLNVASQNIKQLVNLMGGKARDKEDMHFLKAEEIEKKFDVEVEKLKPTPVEKEEEKKPSLVSKLGGKAIDKFKKSKFGKKTMKGVKKITDLKKMFSFTNILKSLGKYLVIGAIITTIFVAFKDSFVEWASSLWESIKESFDEFVGKIKQWFSDVVQPIIDKVIEFVQPLIDVVSELFKKIGDFFVQTFGKIKNFFEPVVEFISNIWNKFMGMIDEFKSFLKPKVESTMKIPGIGKLVPEFLKTWLGIGEVKETKVDDTAEKQKLERQQKESLDTERVRKQQEEKKYKGDDEIVRQRLGIEEKTTTMRAEERKAAAPVAVAAPTPTPTPTVTERPTTKPTVETEKKKAEAPVEKISGMDDVKKMVIKHEGIRFEPYKDSLGLWTVGVGHLIGDGKSLPPEYNRKFSEKEVMDLFEKDFTHHVKIAERTPGYSKANESGKAAFIDLAFNMGQWWPKWPTTKKKLEEGDFQSAAQGLQDSKWYEQVKGRAKTIVSLVAQAGSSQGSSLNSTSTQVAQDQRAQQKPTTPVVINAPTNNTTVVNKTQVASAPQKDTSQTLMARVA